MLQPNIKPLTDIMRELRDPDTGCPWDIQQNFASIAPYTIEEAYEVADAIERGDMDDLRDELGDLLLQVVFHSQMAADAGLFDLNDVIHSICEKMLRRHPHVFGPQNLGTDNTANAGAVIGNWEEIKASERAAKSRDDSEMAGVALSLPALLRAQKLQKRAARCGFDWPDAEGPKAKIIEEITEVEAAIKPADIEEEVGDLLFAAVNYARHLGVDAETALKKGSAKFENRFRHMEQASDAGETFADLTMDEKEARWEAAKSAAKA